jgi:enoyl-CoA hydratase/carnithine racemase
VVVLESQVPGIFCAGADIKWLSNPSFDHEYAMRNEPLHALFDSFQKNRKPIIAAVNGKALGGGFEIALMCDIILASDNSFFALPEINLGLMPGLGGTQRLARIVGEKKAMRHILTGEGFPASQALSMSVAERVSTENFSNEVQNL